MGEKAWEGGKESGGKRVGRRQRPQHTDTIGALDLREHERPGGVSRAGPTQEEVHRGATDVGVDQTRKLPPLQLQRLQAGTTRGRWKKEETVR